VGHVSGNSEADVRCPYRVTFIVQLAEQQPTNGHDSEWYRRSESACVVSPDCGCLLFRNFGSLQGAEQQSIDGRDSESLALFTFDAYYLVRQRNFLSLQV
jgi:hypothetical protein